MKMKWLLLVLALLGLTPAFAQTTWYVRPDGGSRYSENQTNGQCDGKADTAYPGIGSNRHCAFNQLPYLWDDRSGIGTGAIKWVISGGDTVLIRGCAADSADPNPSYPNCRVGWFGATGDTSGKWCYTVGSYTCYNPPIPAGTATQHTRILGQNYASCSVGGATNPRDYAPNLTQLFGGFSLKYALNLGSTEYVDVQCLEVTSHNGKCTKGGYPAYPAGCSGNQPLDDYDDEGIRTDDMSSNILLQDVYVHGFNDAGMFGPIGGPIDMKNVFVGFNGKVGWQFDDGNDTPDAPGSSINASYVTMIGNGCYEEFPVSHHFSGQACYDDVSNGFGDAWSGQDTDLDSFVCDHCVMAYNTKDAFIGPHTNIRKLTITNSESHGNMGAQWKWNNTPSSTTTFENNLTAGDCLAFQGTIPGAAHSFAKASGLPGAYLSDYCRAGGNTVAINSQQNSRVLFANSTFVDYIDTVFLLSCGPAYQNHNQMCGTTPFIFRNNVFLSYYLQGGLPPGLFYIDDPSVKVTQSNNVQYGNRSGYGEVCGVDGNVCADPLLVGEPVQQAWTDPTFLTGLNFHPSSTSPANGAGAFYPEMLPVDFSGKEWPTTPSAGALLADSVEPAPPTQTWTKVANEDDVVSVPAGTTVRYGFGDQWATKTFASATTFTVLNEYFGGDPFPNQVKELDALGNGDGITVGNPPPPPPPPPTLPPPPPASPLPEDCYVWFHIDDKGQITFTGLSCNKTP